MMHLWIRNDRKSKIALYLIVRWGLIDHVYPRTGNLISFVLFCHPLIETFERLCMLLPTLTLLHFYKISRYFIFYKDMINPEIVIGIFALSRLV